MKIKKGRPGKAALKESITKPIIPEKDIYTTALEALRREAVRNGSARLTVFFTDGKETGFTTGHSNSRGRRGGGSGN